MSRILRLAILIIIVVIACGRQPNIVTLDEDSLAYALGKDISSVLPIMDPDSNKILVTSDPFNVSSGEMLIFLMQTFGSRTAQLKDLDAQRLEPFIRQTATQLIEKKLLLRAARKSKAKATAAEVDSIIQLQIERSGGEENYANFLKEHNIDERFVLEDIRNSVLIRNYLAIIVEENSTVTEEQIQEAYQSTITDTTASVRHILLLTQEKTDAEKQEVRKQMETILTRARAGEDFAELAREYTEDPGSKESGGLYENFPRGQMVKPFEDAAFNIPVGEISDIVETRYGYHILKIVDRGVSGKTLKEARPELEQKLREPEWQTIVPAHIQELKENDNVEILF